MAGSIRARAASGVAKLKEHGYHDQAAAIESLLAPGGHKLLQRTEDREPSPLSLTIPVTLKDALVAAADEFDVVFDALAEQAYGMVLDGDWLPPDIRGAFRGMGAKTTLQIFVDGGLRHRVQDLLPGVNERAGWKVTETAIALSFICDELGVELPTAAAATKSPEMRFPKSLVEFWKAEAARLGRPLEAIVSEGVRGLLAGEWTPGRHPYFADRRAVLEGRGGPRRGWSESQRARLYVPLEKELLAQLRERLTVLSGELGYLVHPQTVVGAILTDALGEPAE